MTLAERLDDLKKEIKFTLVKEESNRKYYQCSELLVKSANKFDIIKDIINSFIERLEDGYSKYVNPNGLEYICISDAHTHTERLVFPAFKLEDTLLINHLHIAGDMTMMICGGDDSLVYEPEHYFKQLAEANGYIYDSVSN